VNDGWSRRASVEIGVVLLISAAVRGAYLALMELPIFDPWRHLLLIENLRSGAGFTLFDGQPYLWYSPLWYRFCAAFPEGVDPSWLAGLASVLAAPAAYLLLRETLGPREERAPLLAGLLMALSGPVVAFTCHYGPEAPALCLTLWAAFLAARSRSSWVAGLCGVAFGTALVLRLNFAFNLFLFLPALRRPRRGIPLLAGTAIPLLLTWWRNHRIIAAHDWLFTWDGLATPTAGFGLLSTLMVQMHPAVQEGLCRLHEIVVPRPEWLGSPGLILFVVSGLLCVALSRRLDLILTAGLTLAYFLLLDGTNSSNFFRIWLVVFPAFFLATAIVASRVQRSLAESRDPLLALGLAAAIVLLPLAGGAPMLKPREMLPLSMVTPPASLLTEEAYLVNSSFFHPESLIHRFPDKSFLGMPLDPASFDRFRAAYPGFRQVLWHDFSVQDGLADHLKAGGYRVVEQARNSHGRLYTVLAPPQE